MKLIVLEIIIIVINLSTISNFSNLRTSSSNESTNISDKNEKSINVKNPLSNEDQTQKDKLDLINFDYVLLNLNIIEQKIEEFKSKLKAKKIFEKNQQVSADDETSERLLNDIYFGEYLDLMEDIETKLDLNEENKNIKDNNKNNNNNQNIVSNEFYKFLVKNSKKRNMQYDTSMMFYNSLSLIMLSMLTGGLIGVVLIIYYSLKADDDEINLNQCQ